MHFELSTRVPYSSRSDTPRSPSSIAGIRMVHNTADNKCLTRNGGIGADFRRNIEEMRNDFTGNMVTPIPKPTLEIVAFKNLQLTFRNPSGG